MAGPSRRRTRSFPHLRGEVVGFGSPAKQFGQYQEHHVEDRDALAGHGRMYDLTIFGVVKFFTLAMENNPNVIDSLFTPTTCLLHCTKVGNLVRENRRLFLHKGAWPKFKGYAYSQLHKDRHQAAAGQAGRTGRRARLRHQVRLSCGPPDRRGGADPDGGRHRPPAETTSDSRRSAVANGPRSGSGPGSPTRSRTWSASTPRARCGPNPDEARIKALLLDVLEEHYGSLAGCVLDPDRAVVALRNIQAELDRVKDLL